METITSENLVREAARAGATYVVWACRGLRACAMPGGPCGGVGASGRRARALTRGELVVAPTVRCRGIACCDQCAAWLARQVPRTRIWLAPYLWEIPSLDPPPIRPRRRSR